MYRDQTTSCIPPVKYVMVIYLGGVVRRVARPFPQLLPVAPHGTNRRVYMYKCPITRDYIIAARAHRKTYQRGAITCYYTFKKRAAAIMFALMHVDTTPYTLTNP